MLTISIEIVRGGMDMSKRQVSEQELSSIVVVVPNGHISLSISISVPFNFDTQMRFIIKSNNAAFQ